MEDTTGARSVNGEFPNDDAGALSAERWAEILGIEVKRCVTLMRERSVPRKQIGKRVYARPADFWSAFPYVGDGDNETE
jgi:hypothetical protein